MSLTLRPSILTSFIKDFFFLFISTVESFIPHKNVTIRPRDLG